MQIKIPNKKRIGISVGGGGYPAEIHKFYIEGTDTIVIEGFSIEDGNTLVIS